MMTEVDRSVKMAGSRTGAYYVVERVHVHHSSQPLSKEQALMMVDMWMEEIDPSVSVGEALDAVRAFYAQDGSGRGDVARCRVQDVNRLVRKARLKAVPSDGWLADYAFSHGLVEGDRVWMFKRAVKSLVAQGLAVGEALGEAVRRASGRSPLSRLPESPLLNG